jgi:hypothetical protein
MRKANFLGMYFRGSGYLRCYVIVIFLLQTIFKNGIIRHIRIYIIDIHQVNLWQHIESLVMLLSYSAGFHVFLLDL